MRLSSHGVAPRTRVTEVRKLNEIERIGCKAVTESELYIKPLLPDLSDGCCPLYFPVLVQNPAYVKKYLAEQNIECFNWWQNKHTAVDWSKFPVAEELKRRVVALPVHQKLNVEQIQRAAKHLEQALSQQ